MKDRPGVPTHPPFVQTALFGGRGDVRVWNLLGHKKAPPFTAALRCELAASGVVGAHRQEHHPEILIGLSGDGQATVDGAPTPLNSGAVVHLPLGSVLSITNLSDSEPLDYYIIKAASA